MHALEFKIRYEYSAQKKCYVFRLYRLGGGFVGERKNKREFQRLLENVLPEAVNPQSE